MSVEAGDKRGGWSIDWCLGEEVGGDWRGERLQSSSIGARQRAAP